MCQVRHQQVAQAVALFGQMCDDGEPPNASQCSALLEQCCTRGMGEEAHGVLRGMEDASMALSAKHACQTIAALLRAGLLRLGCTAGGEAFFDTIRVAPPAGTSVDAVMAAGGAEGCARRCARARGAR